MHLSGGAVYFRGDALAWYFQFGIMGGAALTGANRWVVISSSCGAATSEQCQLYRRLATGLTVGSVMADAAMNGPFGLKPPSEVRGQGVVGITGVTAPGLRAPTVHEVLYVRRGSTPLPVEAVEAAVAGGPGPTTIIYQSWAEVRPLRPPSSAEPFDLHWLGKA